MASDRRGVSEAPMDCLEGEMIVATPHFHAIDATSLQDRCSQTEPYDEQGKLLQRCTATLSLHCSRPPLGGGAATMATKERIKKVALVYVVYVEARGEKMAFTIKKPNRLIHNDITK